MSTRRDTQLHRLIHDDSQVEAIPRLNHDITAQHVVPIMYYNFHTNARGRQGGRSKANVIAASSEAEAESMDGVIADTSLEAGEHDPSTKRLLGPRVPSPLLRLNGLRKPLLLDLVLTP